MSKTNEGDISAALIRRAMSIPILDAETEYQLARRWQDEGDAAALNALIEPHLRLVISSARKFRNYGLPIEDLNQEGVLGLMQAARRFDAGRDVRFATYASWWIRSAMTEYVLRNWSLIRLGTTRAQKSLFFNLRRLRNRIEGIGGDAMTSETAEAIARTLKVPLAEVISMERRLFGRDVSINSLVSEDSEDERGVFLVSADPDPEEQLLETESSTRRLLLLRQALDALPERERQIIVMRRLGEEILTLEEVGRKLGVSKERVRQIESRAMGKLRASITAAGDPSDLI